MCPKSRDFVFKVVPIGTLGPQDTLFGYMDLMIKENSGAYELQELYGQFSQLGSLLGPFYSG